MEGNSRTTSSWIGVIKKDKGDAKSHPKDKKITKRLSPNDILGDPKDGERMRRQIKNT